MSTSISLRQARSVLVAVAILVMVGHVCSLADHVDVLPAAAGHVIAHAAPGGHDEPASDESLHAASCELVVDRSTPGSGAVPLDTRAPALVALALTAERTGAPSQPRPAVQSPPLFLLHASLLI